MLNSVLMDDVQDPTRALQVSGPDIYNDDGKIYSINPNGLMDEHPSFQLSKLDTLQAQVIICKLARLDREVCDVWDVAPRGSKEQRP